MKKVVIIEDEVDLCNDLLLLLCKYPQLKVVGTSDNTRDAIMLIREKTPDIVLMDIHLGAESSFDILDAVGNACFHVIFITAYSQHAIKAIKYGALDYLLKPVDEQELSEALARTEEPPRPGSLRSSLDISRSYWDASKKAAQIVLRTQQTVHIVTISDIIYCKSDGCYTTFYLKNAKPVMVSKPIKTYEELLPPEDFLRPHQSFLVNRAFIKGYHRDGFLVLSDNGRIPVSVRKKEKVLRYLSR